jgi:N-methylhydantoinase B/oxoprolinase/acetone carboxylase alpha subunit
MYSGRRVFTNGDNRANEWLRDGRSGGKAITAGEEIDEDDRWFQLYSISFGGIPGRPFGDGPDGHSLWPSFTNVPNEFLEKYIPLRVERCETIPDSGGAGLFRGGNGIRQVFRFLEAGEISMHDDRWLTSPWGVNGGKPGARSTKLLYRYICHCYSKVVAAHPLSFFNPHANLPLQGCARG